MSHRTSMFTLLGIAPFAWVGVALFTYYVRPANLLAFLIFFLILGVALTSSLTPVLYALEARFLAPRNFSVTPKQAIRQCALLSLVVILNLGLRALHSWNIVMILITLGAAVMLEVLILARK